MQVIRRLCVMSLALAIVLVATVGAARAQVTFTTGNHPQANEENILFGTSETGNPINGHTNQSNVGVSFSSTTDTLKQVAKGQADIFPVDGLINDITMFVPNGTYTDAIIDPQDGSDDATVTVNFGGSANGTNTFTYTIGNGSNFLTIIADAGFTINSVTVDSTAGYKDFKQPRISGVNGGGPPQDTPEPGSVALLAGALIPAAGMFLRRKRA